MDQPGNLATVYSLRWPAEANLLQLLPLPGTRERSVIGLPIAKPLPTPAHKKTICGAHLPQGRINTNVNLL